MPPEEIARVLAAMQKLEPWDIPEDVAADLDDWERKINQRGIEASRLKYGGRLLVTRFLLERESPGLYLARKRGVFERAQAETAKGHRIGIAGPVLRGIGVPGRRKLAARTQFARLGAGASPLETVAP